MKRQSPIVLILFSVAVIIASVGAHAERGDDADRASKNGLTTGTIDGVDVTIEYGRPNVNNRTIWGGLVPYDQVWRTGANEATAIEFSSDVVIDGNALPAGRYSLFTIPGEEEWTVIFNNQADQWGAFKYDAEQDALRITATPNEIEHVETMEFLVDDSSVVLQWDNLALPIAIAAD